MKKLFVLFLLCSTYICAMELDQTSKFEQTRNMLSEGNLPAGSISALKKALPHMSLGQIKELEEITTTQLSTCSDNKKEKYKSIDANLKLAIAKISLSHK